MVFEISLGLLTAVATGTRSQALPRTRTAFLAMTDPLALMYLAVQQSITWLDERTEAYKLPLSVRSKALT